MFTSGNFVGLIKAQELIPLENECGHQISWESAYEKSSKYVL